MVINRLKIKNNILYMVLSMMVASAIVLHGVQTFLSLKYGINISYYSLEFLFLGLIFVYFSCLFLSFTKILLIVREKKPLTKWYHPVVIGFLPLGINKIYEKLLAYASLETSWMWLSFYHPVLWGILILLYWKYCAKIQ